ncbi:MAG: hypothetical protein LUD27_06390 [Clostridia bacterium]|nr:hypothetical protein [Clostridia bacterium]
MKKFIAAALCAATAMCCSIGFSACGSETDEITMYMPDGAPALAAAMLMSEDTDLGADVTYNVVDSSLITSYVTGDEPEADVCILPLNAAAQKLGTGETYQLLGTVTHGNLYIVSKTETTEITAANLSSLVGKTVGVVQLTAVPGLTFEVILNDNDIDYNIVGNDGSTSDTAVNLVAMSAASDVSSYDYDYYVIPEPAMSNLTGKMAALTCVGSLQTLYGSEGGYPQAVLVAKTELIQSNPDFITALTSAIETAADWLTLETTSMDTVVSAISGHLTEGLSPTFTAANLSAAVIQNCAIYFTSAADGKAEITSFLSKYSAVSGTTYTVSDSFFYGA